MFCLLLTASSISYFYWLEEELHEKEIFALIDAREWNIENMNASYSQIKLELKEKDHLPEGYTWEEKGREFSYKGMFYDIISIEQTKEGWMIKAASDEEEAAIVANQHKVHSFNKDPKSTTSSESSKIKLNLSFAVYDCNQVFDYKYSAFIQDKKGYLYYTAPILNRYTGEITHPPETV